MLAQKNKQINKNFNVKSQIKGGSILDSPIIQKY